MWRASSCFADSEQTAIKAEWLHPFFRKDCSTLRAPSGRWYRHHCTNKYLWRLLRSPEPCIAEGTLPSPSLVCLAGWTPLTHALAAQHQRMDTQTKRPNFVCKTSWGHWEGKSGQKRAECLQGHTGFRESQNLFQVDKLRKMHTCNSNSTVCWPFYKNKGITNLVKRLSAGKGWRRKYVWKCSA